MSGGSFNYACFKVQSSDVFEGVDDFKAIERWLRENNRHLAADEVYKFILEVETARHRLDVIGARIAGILQAAEWTQSGDAGVEYVDAEYDKLVVASGNQRG